ncbi:MAG: hypothetical protein PHE73_09295 [Sulfurovaceae bacterium]|nr:hypothetical protein [Sulfurovaceae bacterium]
MKHKIPNTNLTLTEAEIQAVVSFAYQRSMTDTPQNEVELDYKNREEYKKYFNKKRLRDKNGQIPSPAPEFSYYRKETL